MAAFKQHGSLVSFGAPVLRKAIITNSVVSILQNSVKLSAGFSALGTTAALVFGHVMAHASALGVGLLTSGVAGASVGSYTNSITAAANNQTVGLVADVCDVSKFTLYSAAENAAIGTTVGSNLAGYFQNLADATQLSESSTLTTTLQYFGWGLDANDSTRSIVNIYQSQVFGV